MTPEFGCTCLALGGECTGCRANRAIRDAVAAERERCAKIAEERAAEWQADAHGSASGTLLQGMADGARIVADQIRQEPTP